MRASAAPTRWAASAIPRSAITSRRAITRWATRRSAIPICGTSGNSIGCSTTARSHSRWRETSARRSVSVRSRHGAMTWASRCPRITAFAPVSISLGYNVSNTLCSSSRRRHGRSRSSAPSTPPRPNKAPSCSNSIVASATARTCRLPPANRRARRSKPFSPKVEWRIEVIPLEHIGTDPNAAQGFMKRRLRSCRSTGA